MRRAEKELAALEKEIADLEAEQAALHERMAAADTPLEERAETGRRLKAIEDSLAGLMTAWEDAGRRRDELGQGDRFL